ncbi:MAG TPA: family 2A encapsulin nanocompartment cargo protein cysteine desulfurase [Chitinophaga sp.]
MSTNNGQLNNHPDGWAPDVKMLEQLANQFFSAPPGALPKAAPTSQTVQVMEPGAYKETLLEQGKVENLSEPQTALPDPHFAGAGIVPQSVAGSGISPSAQHATRYEGKEPATYIPDPQFAGAGLAPKSVAGSGVSPSAIDQGRSFDLKQPPTALPDPHFAGAGLVPQSVAGSGASPFQKGEYAGMIPGNGVSPLSATFHELPFLSEHDYAKDIEGMLNGMSAVSPGAQLPGYGTAVTNVPSYYFLAEQLSSQLPGPGKSATVNGMPAPPYDVNMARLDFPILQEWVHGRRLVWLDNAATTQKPKTVIERISYYYQHENSNIHRAAHDLAARATDAYEEARKKVQHFLNAASPNEIVFVRGATEAINLVAQSWGDQYLKAGDEIVISHLEHHANIVPWQQLANKKGLALKVIPVDDDGQILLEEYSRLLGPKTKLVAFTQVSNALGTVTPARQMVQMAHQLGAKALVDGAQAVSHMGVDVRDLDADWYVFSGHKIFGPTGIGVLYGKEAILNETQPWQGGGNMISDVTFEHTRYQAAPTRFEAGTGNIADAVGLGAALDYVSKIGMTAIHLYEQYLLQYATRLLKEVPGLRLIGTAPEKAGVLSFVLNGFRTEDIGGALNKEGIAVRSGHHCAQPILRRFGVESTVRPSLALYNTCADIDALIAALFKITDGQTSFRR